MASVKQTRARTRRRQSRRSLGDLVTDLRLTGRALDPGPALMREGPSSAVSAGSGHLTTDVRPAWIDGPWVYVVEVDEGPPMAVVAPPPGRRPGPGAYRAQIRLDPCVYCGRATTARVDPTRPPKRGTDGTVEHLTRRADERGLRENIVGACLRCNRSRGPLTPLEMLLRERDIWLMDEREAA